MHSPVATNARTAIALAAIPVAIALLLPWQLVSLGQQSVDKAGPSDRLEFEIVHSFDGKYLGDTPGHMGRIGGLGNRRPKVALGDHVYRGEERVGTVTNLEWNRTNTSLDVEFDPEPKIRILVGDTVWIPLDPTVTAKPRQP